MTIKRITHRGKSKWLLDYGVVDGKRRRQYFDTELEAKRAVKLAQQERLEVGNHWSVLPPEKRVAVCRVLDEMEERGVTLQQVWSAYLDGRTDRVVTKTSIGHAIQCWEKAKAASNNRPRYIAAVVSDMKRFAQGREMVAVSEFKQSDIETWMASRERLSVWSRSVLLVRLRSFFQFCKDRDWCARSPVEKIDRIKAEWKQKEIITPDEAERLLNTTLKVAPGFLWNVVLGLFCGIRQEELVRLKAEAVDLEGGFVTIDATVSKVRRRRIVPISPNAVKWLRLHQGLGTSASFNRRKIWLVRDALGRKTWPQNWLRHSAASYLMAREKDSGKVVNILGNSRDMLMEHYHELVNAADSEKFWKIEPLVAATAKV